MKRHKPMARSATPMRRKNPMGKGKKREAHDQAIQSAVVEYFRLHGEDRDELRVAPCQITGVFYTRREMNAHHKTPRSELLDAKVQDPDAPHRLLMIHYKVHNRLHDFQMGRPKNPAALARFELVEQSEANMGNGWQVELRTV